MGNSSSGISLAQSTAKSYHIESFPNDSTAFRVFVKKRNKFIPGWLKINEDEILFVRNGSAPQSWPIAFLRRYGYTCAGIFFFESGRRCASGEGLHTFQSHQAERVFQVVQSKIRSEELRASRASSVASFRINAANNTTKIHPVQRFSSEGPGNNNFLLSRNPSNHSVTVRRPVPVVSNGVVHSNSSAAVHLLRDRDRPRSVVSAMEYDVNGRLQKAPTPNIMNASYTSQADSAWPISEQQLDGEIVNEHVLNGHPKQLQQRIAQPYQPIPMRPALLNAASGLSQQRKYHSYVNIEFPAEPLPRLSYRELSTASDLNMIAPNRLYTPRLNGEINGNLMTQSMSAAPTSGPAFEPQGDFPPIDRGRQQSTNAAPANRVYAQYQSAIDYSQVPLSNGTRQPMPPPSASASLPKSKIRLASASQRSECSSIASASPSTSSAPASRVNYALIDFNKTRALEQFANVKQRAAARFRQSRFIRKP
ncbi:IRS-type PTB domain-containing protein [Aphelenchoides bicaudatus]|nr:IRS-type PTB domain-containing protein [Aphelenchoides bicaudatus]